MKYSVNWIIVAGHNSIIAGNDIEVTVPEAKLALYCVIYQNGLPLSWSYDGKFSEGVKDQICHIKTQRGIFDHVKKTETDIPMQKGHYTLVTKALADSHSGYATWYDEFEIV